jgi:predicted NBD/HSP70 family sugar kinase
MARVVNRPRQSSGRSLERADQATVRRNNLALVVRHLREHGPRSRAAIAVETGLNKATVSSLVGELVERRLVREVGTLHQGAVGRPAQMLELDGATVGAVGLEVNVDYVAAFATDLAGRVLHDRRIPFGAMERGPAETLEALAEACREALVSIAAADADPAGVTVAVPGLVDVEHGMVTLAPNLQWYGVAVVDHLWSRLGRPKYPIAVDNDANLSALAEYSIGADAGTSDMVYLTGEVGVGGGVIVGGRLLRGADGFSGEVGHITLEPGGARCGCGRRGCWETMVGLAALLRKAAPNPDDPVNHPGLDPEERVQELLNRAERGHQRTLDAFDEIGRALGYGASILVNLFNPRVIVLGGYFARAGVHIVDAAMAELRTRTLAPDAGGCRISLSELGFTAAVRGGVLTAIDAVLANPAIVGPAPQQEAGPGRSPLMLA